MIQTETIEVSLSGEAAAQVRDAVDSGHGSASEVIVDALRNWRRDKEDLDVEHLRAAWEEALQDDRPGLDPEPINARLREKFPRTVRSSS